MTGDETTEADQRHDESGVDDGFVSRLRLIEDQPLESRAAAFTQLHDELQSALERGDAPTHRG